MIGIPNKIGSLILNKAGMIPNLPTVFNCFDLLFNNRTAKPNVQPDPPI